MEPQDPEKTADERARGTPAVDLGGSSESQVGSSDGSGAGEGSSKAMRENDQEPTGSRTLDEATVEFKAAPDRPSRQVQRIADRYEIVGFIGEGGMGSVYLARDLKLERQIALKRLRQPGDADPIGIERFMREARAIAALNHRNIVTIYEMGEDVQGPFIAMEYVSGGDLHQFIRQSGKMAVEQALALIRSVGQALAYAHRRSIVHRDIKPRNILLTDDGSPKLVDFGLARAPQISEEISMTGYGLGTMAYMAPEQRENAKYTDHRSDIYALAKTLYHVLTAESPEIVDFELVPEPIRPALQRALKSRPEDRHFSVDDFLADIESTRTQTFSSAPSSSQMDVNLIKCPHCETANPPEGRFCVGCGAGLFIKCPSCGREQRTGVAHCSHCGMNISGFAKAKQILGEAQQQMGRQEYDKCLETCDKGLGGKYLLGEFQRLKKEASLRLAEIKRIVARVSELIKKERFEPAETLITKGLELDRNQPELKAMLAELPGRQRETHVRRRIQIALEQANHGRIEASHAILEEAMRLHPEWFDVATQLDLVKLSQAQDVVQSLRREVLGLFVEGHHQPAIRRLDAVLGQTRHRAEPNPHPASSRPNSPADGSGPPSAPTESQATAADQRPAAPGAGSSAGAAENRTAAASQGAASGTGSSLPSGSGSSSASAMMAERLAQMQKEAIELMLADRLEDARRLLRVVLRADPNMASARELLDSVVGRIHENQLKEILNQAKAELLKWRFRQAIELCESAKRIVGQDARIDEVLEDSRVMQEDHAAQRQVAREHQLNNRWAKAAEAWKLLLQFYSWDKASAEEYRTVSRRMEELAAAKKKALRLEAEDEQEKALRCWEQIHLKVPDDRDAKLAVVRIRGRIIRTRRSRRIRVSLALLVLLTTAVLGSAWLVGELTSGDLNRHVENQRFPEAAELLGNWGPFSLFHQSAMADALAGNWVAWLADGVERIDGDRAFEELARQHAALSGVLGTVLVLTDEAARQFEKVSRVVQDDWDLARERFVRLGSPMAAGQRPAEVLRDDHPWVIELKEWVERSRQNRGRDVLDEIFTEARTILIGAVKDKILGESSETLWTMDDINAVTRLMDYLPGEPSDRELLDAAGKYLGLDTKFEKRKLIREDLARRPNPQGTISPRDLELAKSNVTRISEHLDRMREYLADNRFSEALAALDAVEPLLEKLEIKQFLDEKQWRDERNLVFDLNQRQGVGGGGQGNVCIHQKRSYMQDWVDRGLRSDAMRPTDDQVARLYDLNQRLFPRFALFDGVRTMSFSWLPADREESFPGDYPFGTFMGRREVTVEQWQAVMGDLPAGLSGVESVLEPVRYVRIEHARAFCDRLSARLAPQIRRELNLPADAVILVRLPQVGEWQRAVLAGHRQTRFHGSFCMFSGRTLARFEDAQVKAFANLTPPGGDRPPIKAVRGRDETLWGLFDLFGNVAEWANDESGNGRLMGGSVRNIHSELSGGELFRGAEFRESELEFAGLRVVLEIMPGEGRVD